MPYTDSGAQIAFYLVLEVFVLLELLGVDVLGTQLDWPKQEIIDDPQLDQAVEGARDDFLDWVKRGQPTAP